MTAELPKKEYLTTTDLVGFLGVTRQAIQQFRELSRDPLPCIRIYPEKKDGSTSKRGLIRFSYLQVKAWMDRRSVYNSGPKF